MHYKYKPSHIHRHLFAMLMSCDGDRTSVATRPCWDGKGCHANPSPTPSLSLGHIKQLSVCVAHKHTLTNQCCLCDMHFIMLFFWLELWFLHLHCVLQMTLCCQNNEQLRFYPSSCGLCWFYFVVFVLYLVWLFQVWLLVIITSLLNTL